MHSYSLKQVADILGVTRQAVYLQKKQGKLKSYYVEGEQKISAKEIARYRQARYSRDQHFAEGWLSTKKAARVGGTDLNRIYYLIYKKILPATFKNGMWYIKIEDLEECNLHGKLQRQQRIKKDDRNLQNPDKDRIGVKHLGTLDEKSSEKEKAKASHKIVPRRFARYPAMPSKTDKGSTKRSR